MKISVKENFSQIEKDGKSIHQLTKEKLVDEISDYLEQNSHIIEVADTKSGYESQAEIFVFDKEEIQDIKYRLEYLDKKLKGHKDHIILANIKSLEKIFE